MKNVLEFFILSIISLFIVIPVNAEECDYGVKANLNKKAFNVQADYEFQTAGDGSTYFDIIIYNIVEEIYVNYQSELEGKNSMGTNVSLNDATNGTYRFSIPIPTKSYEYTFTIRTTIDGCSGDLRKFTLTIPIRNKYHDSDNCKREGMEDYYYCKEWITQEFSMTDRDIETKIENKYESLKKNRATKCVGCEETARNNAKIKKFNKLKKQILIGLVIGIIIDGMIMILQIINIRRSEI